MTRICIVYWHYATSWSANPKWDVTSTNKEYCKSSETIGVIHSNFSAIQMIQLALMNNVVVGHAVITLYTVLIFGICMITQVPRKVMLLCYCKKGVPLQTFFSSITEKPIQDCPCTVSYVQTSQLHQHCSKPLMWQAQELYVCPVKVLVYTSGWHALFPNSFIIGIHMQTFWIQEISLCLWAVG